MKLITTTIIALAMIFTACSEASETKETTKTGSVASPEEKQAIFKQFEGVTSVEVWRKVDGMNSSPIVIEEATEIKDFYNLIGTKIDIAPSCKFTGGITYTKENGEMIFAEINISDDCQFISYVNEDNEVEYHTIRPEGLDLLKSTIDKIELPK